jgi:hypothetical protein
VLVGYSAKLKKIGLAFIQYLLIIIHLSILALK